MQHSESRLTVAFCFQSGRKRAHAAACSAATTERSLTADA